MAVAVVQIGSGSRGWNQTFVNSFTTPSITAAANTVLVLLVGTVDENAGSTGIPWPATCVSSAGGPTWIAIGNSGTTLTADFKARTAGWYAVIGGTAPGPFTVTVDGNGASRFAIYDFVVWQGTGHDIGGSPVPIFIFAENQAGNGPNTITLPSAPNSADATVAISIADENSGAVGATFGTTFGTWTQTFTNAASGQTLAGNGGYRLSSTSPTVEWSDVNLGSDNFNSAQAAVVIKALVAGPPTLVVADCAHAHTAGNIVLTGLPFAVDNGAHALSSTTIAFASGIADDFNRANGPLGGNWLFDTGAWTIVSNLAHRQGTFGDQAVYNANIGSANHYVEADLGDLVTYVTLMVRTSPADRGVNFYEAYIEPLTTTARIAKTVAGAFTIINSATGITYGDPYHGRFEAEGSTLRFYVNGVLAVTATDTSLATGTYAGMSAASGINGTVDNWTAGQLVPAGVTLTVANGAHALSSDVLTLTTGTQLTVADANHGHTAANVVLTGVVFVIIVNSANHAFSDTDPFANIFAYPVAVSGRKFIDQFGKVYLLNDFSSWGMAQNLSNSEITQALGNLATRKFKSAAIAFCGVFIQNDWVRYQNKAGQNFFTGAPFVTNAAGSGFGPAWSTFDWIMSEATRLKLTINVTFFVSYGNTGIRADLEAAGNTNAYNFGVALATRYAQYKNIVWHVMSDTGWQPTDPIGQRLDQVFKGITDTRSPRGLIVAEPYLGGTGYQMFIGNEQPANPSGYQWLRLSANSVYDYGSANVEQFDVVWNENSAYPVYDSEPPYVSASHYTGIYSQQVRERNYCNVIRGGVGTNYGDEGWWTFGKLGLFVTSYTWDQVVNRQETLEASYAWDLLEQYCADPTWVPDNAVVSAAGLGSGDTKAGAGRSDGAILVYFPSSRAGITVNTTLIAGTGNVRLRWFDPFTNTYNTIAASEAQTAARAVTYPATIHPDAGRDFILVVDEPQLVVNDSFHAVTDSGPLTLVAFSGGTDLVVNNAAHALTDQGPLALVNNPPVAPANANHGHTADNVVLTTAGVVTIVVADCNHTMTSTIVALNLGPVALVVDNSFHGLSSTTINFQASNLPSHSTVTGDVTVIRTPPVINVTVVTQFGD
jgi:Protein of unknown function (DUF4038)/Putative collagen-binding domain of a collagenase